MLGVVVEVVLLEVWEGVSVEVETVVSEDCKVVELLILKVVEVVEELAAVILVPKEDGVIFDTP